MAILGNLQSMEFLAGKFLAGKHIYKSGILMDFHGFFSHGRSPEKGATWTPQRSAAPHSRPKSLHLWQGSARLPPENLVNKKRNSQAEIVQECGTMGIFIGY